jgi:hypothetical protein
MDDDCGLDSCSCGTRRSGSPSPRQLSRQRHLLDSGASRFAFNQSLRLGTDVLAASRTDLSATVPWSGFDLINAFNRWKASERAGRVFVVAPDGTPIKQVTGLSWRTEVSAQVFEEAAVDLGRALARYAEAKGQVGFPRHRRKGRHRESFRLRNKKDPSGRDGIRVGEAHPRSVTVTSSVRVGERLLAGTPTWGSSPQPGLGLGSGVVGPATRGWSCGASHAHGCA